MHGVRCPFYVLVGCIFLNCIGIRDAYLGPIHTGQLYIHGSCVLCIGILVAIIFTFIMHNDILAAYTCLDHVYMLCMLIHLSSVRV